MNAPPWVPDSALVTRLRPSPNHDERRGWSAPDSVILHYTGMADGPSALERLSEAASGVSCHYVVDEEGGIVQLVPEARRAWCAGRSFWAGDTDLNSASVNIEIVNGGHEFGLPPFPEPQIEAVMALVGDILRRHAIRPERVLAHSDVAPSRKEDPGERFPWPALGRAGLCVWVPPGDDRAPALVRGGEGDAVARLRGDLARLGYGLAPGRTYDDDTATVVRAFQRRHRPAAVDGMADAGTLDTLARLLALDAVRLSPRRAPAPGPA